MKRIVLACLFALSMSLSGGIAAAQVVSPDPQAVLRPAPEAEPLIVFVKQDPWAMVIGSDSPAFALYGDGTAIYRRGAALYSARLDPKALQAFLESLRLEGMKGRKQDFSLSNSTDQPMTWIHMWVGPTYSRISIYGAPKTDGSGVMLPVEVADLYRRLNAFEWPGEAPWMPAEVEVMIWPYEYAPEDSIIWPAGWPTTRDPGSLARGDGFSLYLPGADYQKLRAFLGTRRERGAVLIDGKKWAASVRFPFPKEARWMGGAPE